MKEAALEKLLRITKQFIKLRAMGHLWNALIKLHYADVASLVENLNPQERQLVIKLLYDRSMDTAQIAEIVSEIKPEIAVELLSELDTGKIVEILEELSSDDAASLIALFEEEVQMELLRKINREDSEEIQEQLAYPEESAGRVMSSDFLALDETTSAGDAISAIQLANEDVDVPFYLYVIDEEQRLKGVVSLKQLILVNPRIKLKEIMNYDVYKVDVFTDQEEVAAVVANYNLLAVPVVDELDKLVGVVTVDDIIDIIQNEATEDIYKLAGVDQDYSLDLGIRKSVKKKFPWLFISFCTTSLSAFVAYFFTSTIKEVITLAVLMHIVPAIGGVVGNQTVAIMVREIVIGGMEWHRSKTLLFKELFASTLSGIAIGLIAIGTSYLAFDDITLGAIFGGTIIFNLFMAALVGMLVPLVMKKLKLDPALASGMIVTMLTDVLGLLSFLGLATIFLIK